MIRHVVVFKWKADASAEQRRAFETSLNRLPEKIDFVRRFEVGQDVLRGPTSYDLCVIADFDDMDALKRYATHPDHLPVVEQATKLTERCVVDFEVQGVA